MKYIIISPAGYSFYLVARLNQIESVDKIYYHTPSIYEQETGNGLPDLPAYSKLEMADDIGYALNRCKKEDTIIIVDYTGYGEMANRLRNEGWKVVGGGILADKLEKDRTLATSLMKKVMEIPETLTFDTFEAGYAFAKSQEKTERFVFKPFDNDAPKEYTYVAKDVTDLIEKMKEFKKVWKWKTDFQLQKVVDGIEVDFSGYFNGKEYVDLIIYFENKQIMNDNVGPSGGGAIAVQFAGKMEGVFFDILEKLKPVFIKDGYRGCVAVNCIVSEDNQKPYFLEFTNRFGYPQLPMEITMLEDNNKSIHDLFTILADGKDARLFVENKPCAVVTVGIPPYPITEGDFVIEKTKNIPLSWDKKWDDYFFPVSIKKGKGDQIVLSGGSSEVLQVTCIDQTLDGAISMLYNDYMPTLQLKGAMYRTDLGKDAKKRIKKLRDWKLI